MNAFHERNGILHAEQVPLTTLAERHGTPAYVYSRAAIEARYRAFNEALAGHAHQIHFAVKANANIAVLNVLARLGSGFDIVSGGELVRVLRAGGDPAKVVFSGVGKTEAEMQMGLEAGIGCFNVESASELRRLNAVAVKRGQKAPVALRVNPDVDAKTHPYISTGMRDNKFGIDIPRAEALYAEAAAMPGIALQGIASHIGSQLLDIQPLLDALDRVLAMIDRLAGQGIRLTHIDVGGGLGVRYRDEVPPEPAVWAAAVKQRLAGRDLVIGCEPGRAIVGEAGVLLTRVEALKAGEGKHFAVVDAAMNDLLRPTLYQAWMDIRPVVSAGSATPQDYDVVGPICETGDWLGKGRRLALAEGDLLAVCTAGAYGFVMASNYNTRPRPVELMVDGDQVHVIRARESLDDLLRGEMLLP